MSPNQALGAFNPRFQCEDTQFVALNLQHDFIPRIDAQRPAKGCRNYNPSIHTDAYSTMAFHVLATLQMNGDVL
jgi:hypothetical protein